MTFIDYLVLVGFMVWMLVIGAIFSTRVKDSADMFAAGRQSPWWISGLSGFMTIFSAGTFVVWGGIAYRLGLVAVSILMVIGMSTVLAGATVASRWHRIGITTPTEFFRIRFNEPVVQAYTWIGMVYRGIGLGVGLYALAVMLSVLVPLSEGNPFRDPQTGNLSVTWSILMWGTIVITYTMAGGLWAVLMTDVIQCLLLCLVVLLAVPLSIHELGGLARLWHEAPEGFFSPAVAEYTYTFLFFWFWISFFRYAADWAFVQRYICVPTERDARKVAYLMGGLYIVSPLFWMFPAMVYRILAPDADPEEAYMLICGRVLPAGMLGITVAAMFSATASMVSSLLNVFAGVFACDVYRPLFDPGASERRLVLVGRLATLAYGALVVGIALAVPYVGGAEEVVLVLVTSLLGPLMLPAVWGVYSRHVGPWAVWATLLVCGPVAIVVKCGPGLYERLPSGTTSVCLASSIQWLKANPRLVDALLGLALPFVVLIVVELLSRVRGVDPGWLRMQAACDQHSDKPASGVVSRLPARIVAASLGMLGVFMGIVTACAKSQQITLAVFTTMLLLATAGMAWYGCRREDRLDNKPTERT